MSKMRTMLLFLGLACFIGLFYFFYSRSSAKMIDNNSSALTKNYRPEKIEGKKNEIIPDTPPFPLYPGTTIENSIKRTMGTRDTYYIHLDTPAGANELITFYQKELQANGWTITELNTIDTTLGEGSVSATKDNMEIMVNLERESESEPSELVVNIFVEN